MLEFNRTLLASKRHMQDTADRLHSFLSKLAFSLKKPQLGNFWYTYLVFHLQLQYEQILYSPFLHFFYIPSTPKSLTYAKMTSVVPLQIFSFIAFIFHIPVLIWYVRIKNIPASCLATWFALLSLNAFVSTTIWVSPDITTWWDGIIYCDIMVRVLAGCNTGILCATTAVARNLATIMSNNGPKLGFNSFRARMVDLAICLLLPVLLMALVYIVQQRRYYIYQYQGCALQVAPGWASFAIVVIWPPILSVATSAYVILTIFRYLAKRKDAKDVLHCSGSGMTIPKFLRFFAFCAIVIGLVVPFSIYHMVVNIMSMKVYIAPFNWSVFHSSAWQSINTSLTTGPSMDQYVDCVLAYVSLVCFGTGQDIGEWYLRGLDIIRIGWIFRAIGKYLEGAKQKVFKKKEEPGNRYSTSSGDIFDKVYYTHQPTKSATSASDDSNTKTDKTYFTEGDDSFLFDDNYSIDYEMDSIPISPHSMTSHTQLIKEPGNNRSSPLADLPQPIIRGVRYKSQEWNAWNHTIHGDREAVGPSEYTRTATLDSPTTINSEPPITITEEYRVSNMYNSKKKGTDSIV